MGWAGRRVNVPGPGPAHRRCSTWLRVEDYRRPRRSPSVPTGLAICANAGNEATSGGRRAANTTGPASSSTSVSTALSTSTSAAPDAVSGASPAGSPMPTSTLPTSPSAWTIRSPTRPARCAASASYSVEVARPFGRNKHGIAKLIVTKDRPGWIRQHAAGVTIAELHLKSDGTGLTAELHPASSASDTDGGFRPTVIMEHVSRALERGPALTLSQIRGAVNGRAVHVDLAVTLLVHEGFVAAVKQGQSTYHSNIKRFPSTEPENDERF